MSSVVNAASTNTIYMSSDSVIMLRYLTLTWARAVLTSDTDSQGQHNVIQKILSLSSSTQFNLPAANFHDLVVRELTGKPSWWTSENLGLWESPKWFLLDVLHINHALLAGGHQYLFEILKFLNVRLNAGPLQNMDTDQHQGGSQPVCFPWALHFHTAPLDGQLERPLVHCTWILEPTQNQMAQIPYLRGISHILKW